MGTGMGSSKRASEHVASQKALAFLQSKDLLPKGPHVIPDLPEAPVAPNAIVQAAPGAQPPAQPNAATSEYGFTPEEQHTWVLTQLGGKAIEDLGPLELKNALERALQRNTELKASLHHDQQRRHRAMAILLGIT